MEIIKIRDGVTLCYLKSSKFTTNYLSVNFMNKLGEETASLYSLIPFVLKRGSSENKNMLELNKKLDELYGANLNTSIRKKGDVQIVSLSLEFLNNILAFHNEDVFKKATEFLFSVMNSPLLEDNAFKKEYVEQEKSNLIDIINAQINDKRTYALNRCVEEMCKGEAFGLNEIGDMNKIKEISEKTLFESYQKLLSSSQVMIFFEGVCEKEQLISILEKTFAQNRYNEIETAVNFEVTQIKDVIEELSVSQGKLTLGFRLQKPTDEREAVVYSLFNMIFGGSPHSKLFENVREKLSLCYYCASRVEKHKGVMFVYSGVENENKEKAFNEILAQLGEIKNGNITQNEFEAAKKSLKNAYISSEDSVAATEDFYLGQYLLGFTLSPAKLTEFIEDITVIDVIAVANKALLDTVYFLKAKKEDEPNEDRNN